MNRERLFTLIGPASLALMQMTAPTPTGAAFMLVPICGQYGGQYGGQSVPLRLPGKPDPANGSPCCKICHISMRKRGQGLGCCDEGDEPDVI